MTNNNDRTRDEKDDLSAKRVVVIMEAVGPKFTEDGDTIEEVLEAFLYAAHYVNSSNNPGTTVLDTLNDLTKIVFAATIDREVEKAAENYDGDEEDEDWDDSWDEDEDDEEEVEYDDDFDFIVNEEDEEVRPEVSE